MSVYDGLISIAIAPNAFRSSLTAIEAVQQIQAGLQRSRLNFNTLHMPLADGGDGTLDTWLSAKGGERYLVTVEDPLGRPIEAEFGMHNTTAMVEMARASGIELLAKDERNPMRASTYGTGQLIRAAVKEFGATEVLIGVGGSATVDGGLGCLQALGAIILDGVGNTVERGAAALAGVGYVNLTPLREAFRGISFKVLCDVANPLVGDNGAAHVFGPQKGADASDVKTLDLNLTHFAHMLKEASQIDITHMPRAGAAGGLSGGLHAALDAELLSGIDYLIDTLGYRDQLVTERPSYLITGEGKLDTQTGGGKGPLGIAAIAYELDIPVIALVGALDVPSAGQLQEWHIDVAYSIVQRPCTMEEAISNAGDWLRDAATSIGELLALQFLG